MANRIFSEFTYQLDKKITQLHCAIDIGAAGAPTFDINSQGNSVSKGFLSVVRAGAGMYILNLGTPGTPNTIDTYYRLMNFQMAVYNPLLSIIKGSQVSNDSSSSITNPFVRFVTLNAAGAVVDPESGTTLMVTLTLKNTFLY